MEKASFFTRKWEASRGFKEFIRTILQDECIKLLSKYSPNVIQFLERKVPPEVRLLQKKAGHSAGSGVTCHVTGFYPREVEVTWLRDGQGPLEEGVWSGEVLPNMDGTYQVRKTLTVSPEEQERHRYTCQVDHTSLGEKIEKEWGWLPEVRLLQKKAGHSAGSEVTCHVTGFYPREVEVTWLRDGQGPLEEGVWSGEVLPNMDGTYQVRKTLTVSPEEQERHRYTCQVDHTSLGEKIEKEWVPETGLHPGLIAGVVVGVLVLIAVIAGLVIWKKRQAVPETGLHPGLIAGVVVGVLVLIAVIAGLVIWKKRQAGVAVMLNAEEVKTRHS
ncbi:UNVERIFIED_CONTAM: hypothetical protein FKN15_021946 [Acipenser sinensis]